LVNSSKSNWTDFIGDIEFSINNSVHSSTGVSPMELLTGLTAPSPLSVAQTTSKQPLSTWSETRDETRQSARDALIFAQNKMSIYYDKKHQPISFQPGDKAYISLAASMETGYHLPNTVSHKLSPQRAGPFEVLRAVGNLAYELKVPASWKIHPVISVAHLEPFKDDPFQRLLPPVPDLITDDNSTPHEEWEVEDILKQRFNRRR
jgi:hypothetical protein